MIALHIEPHPSLHVRAFTCRFPAPLGELESNDIILDALRIDADTPFQPDDAVRSAVRDMLRSAGYKPTGRGKPASEFLVRAASEGSLTSINPAVDACNAASLHGGLPISVIDLDRALPPLRIAIAGPDDHYIFNASGQEIRLAGLPCLHDAHGPCANPVKDSQRTKTGPLTQNTLSVIWGVTSDSPRVSALNDWYRALLAGMGATTEPVG